MFNKKEEEHKTFKKKVASNGLISVSPKKDFRIVTNKHDISLVKGEKIEVPEVYVQNLKTEGVI